MVYRQYHEAKPHYVKMVIWRVLNVTLFPLLPLSMRECMLRLFGAKIGRGGVFYRSVRVYAPWNLSLGDGAVVGPRVELYNKGKITIGDKVIVSQDSFICTASHDVNSRSIELVVRPIELGSYSWVASRTIVLPGVAIGEGAVVGAGAVVTKNVEPWTVVGGNPAKVLKTRVISD